MNVSVYDRKVSTTYFLFQFIFFCILNCVWVDHLEFYCYVCRTLIRISVRFQCSPTCRLFTSLNFFQLWITKWSHIHETDKYGDETWVPEFARETKQQSFKWCIEDESKLKENVKTVQREGHIDSLFDCQGIVYYDCLQ